MKNIDLFDQVNSQFPYDNEKQEALKKELRQTLQRFRHVLGINGKTRRAKYQVIRSFHMNLADVYRMFEEKNLWVLPEWQREFVWNRNNQQAWFDLVATAADDGSILPGTLVLGRFRDQSEEDPRYFINDGHQRIRSTVNMVRALLDGGESKEEVMNTLAMVTVEVTQFLYDSTEDACDHFFCPNRGTLCTGYEQGQAVYAASLSNYEEWKKIFLRLHTIVDTALVRLGLRSLDTQSKETRDKNKRDDVGMFYRFLVKDKKLNSYKTSCKQIDPIEYYLDSLLERQVVREFKKRGIDEIKKKVENFGRFLDQQVALYKQLWNAEGFAEGYVPNLTHTKFYFSTAIYRRNNSIPHSIFVGFVETMIKETGGAGCTRDEHGRKIGNTSMSLGDLSKLPSLCKTWEALDLIHFPKRGSINYDQTQPGYDHSHKKSFAHNLKDGKKVLEPAPLNRSRGTRDMDEEEND